MKLQGIVFFAILLLPLLYGQEEEGVTTRYLMIKGLAETDDREQKMLALVEADKLLAENPSDGEKGKILEVMAYLAAEGVTNLTYEGRVPAAKFGAVRALAAEILGEYGGEESLRPLIDILFYDDDPGAIGSAASAAVAIEAEDKGNVVLAFSRILKNTRRVYNDERLIQEVLESVGLWAESSPGIFDSEDLMDGLNFCSRGESGYSRTTRNMALELIRTAALKENAPS